VTVARWLSDFVRTGGVSELAAARAGVLTDTYNSRHAGTVNLSLRTGVSAIDPALCEERYAARSRHVEWLRCLGGAEQRSRVDDELSMDQ
jgi:hypothetical protein